VFLVGELGATRTTVIPIRGEYNRLEGWWSATELRVGHGVCTEGCTGRFAWSARLRVRDERLAGLGPADRARGPVDQVVSDDRGGLVMTSINEDPSEDIRIDWPANAAAPDGPRLIASGHNRR